MKVAIYARYSSDKQRAASIDDQVRNCQALAMREGWPRGKVYADRAQSGAKRDRPEYQRMLADAEAREFDVLLVDDLSRLSRNNAETLSVLERLRFWGIRIVGVSDGYDSASKSHKVVSGVRGIVNDIYLEDLREKTHRGLAGKALSGQNTGGRAYGYAHVPIEDRSRKDQFGRPKVVGVRRKVDPEQAAVVRQIFRWFGEGRGYREIAAKLNKQGVPSPRGGTWAASTIRPMLRNEIYVGRLVWNKREWERHPDTRKRRPKRRPEAEWIVTKAPELRIVDDKLWAKVQQRRGELQSTHDARKERGKKRPGKAPTYLFSGIVKCGECGGDYIKANKTHYRCSTYINRGTAACTNGVSVRRDVLEQKLLLSIKSGLFDEKSFAAFKREARRVLQARLKDRTRDASKLRRDLEKVEREIANISKAIRAGIITETTKRDLEDCEAAKRRLEAELEADLPAMANLDDLLDDTLGRFAAMAFSIEDFTGRDISKARNLIRSLVGGSIVLEKVGEDGLQARLRGSYIGLVGLVQDAMPKKKAGQLRPLIEALAQWAADDAIASRDAGLPKRKRLPRKHYKKRLAKKAEAPGAGARGSKAGMVAGAGFEPATFRL